MQALVSEALGHGRPAVDPVALAAQVHRYRSAALLGAHQTAARSSPLMQKHHALARAMLMTGTTRPSQPSEPVLARVTLSGGGPGRVPDATALTLLHPRHARRSVRSGYRGRSGRYGRSGQPGRHSVINRVSGVSRARMLV